eukprot:tig00021582_g22611.t1
MASSSRIAVLVALFCFAAIASAATLGPRLAVSRLKFEEVTPCGQRSTEEITLTNVGDEDLVWSIKKTTLPVWLEVLYGSGFTIAPGSNLTFSLIFFANAETILDGTAYYANVTILAYEGEGDNGTLKHVQKATPIEITMNVPAGTCPQIVVSDTSITNVQFDGDTFLTKLFVTNAGNSTLRYTVDTDPGNDTTEQWLFTTGDNGVLLVYTSTDHVGPGTYRGAVKIRSNDQRHNMLTIPVTMTVTEQPIPTISVSPSPVIALRQRSGENTTLQVKISNTSPNATLGLVTLETGGFLPEGMASRQIPVGNTATVELQIDSWRLKAGEYKGNITVLSNAKGNARIDIAVFLIVDSQAGGEGQNISTNSASGAVSSGAIAAGVILLVLVVIIAGGVITYGALQMRKNSRHQQIPFDEDMRGREFRGSDRDDPDRF